MTDLERSLTYLEAQVKYLMQRDGEREGSAMAHPPLTTDPTTKAIATISGYNAAHPDAPMTLYDREKWEGHAPDNWVGGKVLFKTGATGNVAGRWTATIGYRAKAKHPEPGDPVDPVSRDYIDAWAVARCSETPESWQSALQACGLRLVRDLSEEERRELADKMAREAYIKHCLHGDARGNREHLQAVFGPNHRPDFSHYAKSERYTARAGIDAVLGPVNP